MRLLPFHPKQTHARMLLGAKPREENARGAQQETAKLHTEEKKSVLMNICPGNCDN